MSDLISRSALLELIGDTPLTDGSGYNSVYVMGCLYRQNDILNMIDSLPAYDLDKVVERLYEIADDANDHVINTMYEYYDGKEDGIREAIEIVKVGGVNERD